MRDDGLAVLAAGCHVCVMLQAISSFLYTIHFPSFKAGNVKVEINKLIVLKWASDHIEHQLLFPTLALVVLDVLYFLDKMLIQNLKKQKAKSSSSYLYL